MGPAQGMSETRRAADAPLAARMSAFLAVGAEEDGLDLDFVEPALGEEGADGAVDDAGGEDFLFGRASFALEVAAGEAAGCGGALAVIDGQGEEFLAGLRLGGGDCGDQHDGFAELNSHGDPSACLASLPDSMIMDWSPIWATTLSAMVTS
jgi:hypothetical protein